MAPPEARDRRKDRGQREHEQHVRQDADLIEQLHRVHAEEQRAEERHQRRERMPAGEIQQHGGCKAKRLLRGDERTAYYEKGVASTQERRKEERIEHRPKRIVRKRIAVQDVLRREDEDLGVGPENAGGAEMKRMRAPPPTITRMAIATPGRSSQPATFRNTLAVVVCGGRGMRLRTRTTTNQTAAAESSPAAVGAMSRIQKPA